MTRRFIAAGAILCALAVSACNVTSGQVAGIVVAGQTVASATGKAELVARAQQRVVQACGFLPTAQTVALIAHTFAPGTLSLVDTIATGICAAVANPRIAYASGREETRRQGTYRNVPIRGRRVDQR
jgi:hypothetical protein